MAADALEIDVWPTRDGHFVVVHDATVNRTTKGEGTVVEKTLSELRGLDAGSWFSAEFREEKIPTLDEVLTLLDSTTLLIVELKGKSDGGDIESNPVKLIRSSGRDHQTILKSFDSEVIKRFKTHAPEIPRLFVYAFRIPWLNLIVGTGLSSGSVFDIDAQYLQPHALLLSASFVREAHQRGFKVVAWGVDDEAAMHKAIADEVDGIETDRPDLLKRILAVQSGQD